MISRDIYETIVRHGYDGIDQSAFRQLVRVHVAGNRHPGRIQAPARDIQHRVTEIASYRQSA